MTTNINPNKFKKAFGLAIRKARHKLDISQEAFAERADIHRTYVSDIELGKVDVGIGVAYKLSQALQIPLHKLIARAEKGL